MAIDEVDRVFAGGTLQVYFEHYVEKLIPRSSSRPDPICSSRALTARRVRA
jgi:hypothetical protein